MRRITQLHLDHAGNTRQPGASVEAYTGHAHRQAFYPLTFPISCGSASISVVRDGFSELMLEIMNASPRLVAAFISLDSTMR